LKRFLADSKREGVKLFKAKGYQMVSDAFPQTQGQIYDEIRNGVEDDATFGKCAIFSPDIDINYENGSHSCHPVPLFAMKTGLLLLHYKYLGIEYVLDRYEYLRRRCQAPYMKPPEWHRERFHQYTRQASQIIS
jgi:hypothetical protein